MVHNLGFGSGPPAVSQEKTFTKKSRKEITPIYTLDPGPWTLDPGPCILETCSGSGLVFLAGGSSVRETEILVAQQPPQGVFVCDYAGRVTNKLSTPEAFAPMRQAP